MKFIRLNYITTASKVIINPDCISFMEKVYYNFSGEIIKYSNFGDAYEGTSIFTNDSKYNLKVKENCSQILEMINNN